MRIPENIGSNWPKFSINFWYPKIDIFQNGGDMKTKLWSYHHYPLRRRIVMRKRFCAYIHICVYTLAYISIIAMWTESYIVYIIIVQTFGILSSISATYPETEQSIISPLYYGWVGGWVVGYPHSGTQHTRPHRNESGDRVVPAPD